MTIYGKMYLMEDNLLKQIIEDSGHKVRSYSGRGMYGKECLGVTVGRSGIGKLVADIIMQLADMHEDTPHSVVAEAFEGMCTDSMGTGTIVYFPDTPFTVDEEEEDDEEFDDGAPFTGEP